MNLLERARYGEIRGVEVLADHPEVRLVLFSLQKGQEVRGRGGTPGPPPLPRGRGHPVGRGKNDPGKPWNPPRLPTR